jgi:hypothetical protein
MSRSNEPDPSIGHWVAREDHNEEAERLLDLIKDSKSRLRAILAGRERQLRYVARMSRTGGWTLLLEPLRLLASVEWLLLHGFEREPRPGYGIFCG